MGGGFGATWTVWWGRLTRGRSVGTRWRWRLAQLLLALLSVPLLAYDQGTLAALPDRDGFWHDISLPLLVLAATLPVWRAPEEGLPDARRLRELHRRVCRRAAVVLLLGACVALAFNHWYAWHGSPASATAASHVGVVLFLFSPVPWVLLDPLLWLLWPAPVRRAVRAGRAAESLYRATRRRVTARRVIITDLAAGSITDFDADLGAAGRPAPLLHQPAGPRSPGRCTAPARARRRNSGPYLRWDGTGLFAADRRGRVRAVRLADEDHGGGVSELVWLVPSGHLLFLDRDGYRLSPPLTGLQAQPGTVGEVARAAGLVFNAYQLSHWPETREEQAARLFPRRLWWAHSRSGPR